MKKGLLLYLGSLVCFGIVGCNKSNGQINDKDSQFVKNGFISRSFDESGNARTAIKCLKSQSNNIDFEIFVGHSKYLSSMIDDNYFLNYNNASFAIIEIISDDGFNNIYSRNNCMVIKDFLDDKYLYEIINESDSYEFKYSFSTNISLSVTDLPTDSGRIDFVLSLVDCDGAIVDDRDAFYGIDNCASLYFNVDGNSVLFNSNK